MGELPSFDSESTKKDTKRINSPSQMVKALGFLQDPKTAHSRDRESSKDFQGDDPYPAVKTLHSADVLGGQFEEISIGVRLEEPLQIWTQEQLVVSNVFLNWFVEKGGNLQLATAVRELEDSEQKNRVRKDVMREKGYSLMAQIIEQAEELGYFEYLREKLSHEFREKKAISEKSVKMFLAEFPRYMLINRFSEERVFYAAEQEIKGKRVVAMQIKINPHLDPDNTGTIEFQLGSMRIDKEGTLSNFRQKDLPRLPSNNQYPQRWFKGEMSTIIEQAIKARKRIQTELEQ